MPNTTLNPPGAGLHSVAAVSSKVKRRTLSRPVHKIRLCRDNRNYVFIPFTIDGIIATADYGPMWRVDRDYWIAKLTANIGKHDDGTHPLDGTPGGSAILLNMRRVTGSLGTDSAILASDSRLKIAENHHQDAANNDEEGRLGEDDFNITRLAEGQHIYPRISQVGSSRPGTNLVVTAVLVPIP